MKFAKTALKRPLFSLLLTADVHLVLFIFAFFVIRISVSPFAGTAVFLIAGTCFNTLLFRGKIPFLPSNGVSGTWCLFMVCALVGDLLLILCFRKFLAGVPFVFGAVLLPLPLTAAVLAFSAKKSRWNDWKTLLLFPVGVLLLFSCAALILQQVGENLVLSSVQSIIPD